MHEISDGACKLGAWIRWATWIGASSSLFMAHLAFAKVERCTPSEWKHVGVVRAQVSRGVDGDTVRVFVGKREYSVRMLAIDTPETNYLGKSQGHWGEVAKKRLAELLPPNSRIELRFEGLERCDQYGRLLAHVWRGKMNVNRQMLVEALAVNYCIYPADDCGELAPIVQKNIDERQGIFGDASVELPYEWRRQLRGEDYAKYVGSLFTYEVYEPGEIARVPVAERVFFIRKSDIKPPYYLVQ